MDFTDMIKDFAAGGTTSAEDIADRIRHHPVVATDQDPGQGEPGAAPGPDHPGPDKPAASYLDVTAAHDSGILTREQYDEIYHALTGT